MSKEKKQSPSARALRRFKRNTPAVFGFVVICFSVVLAILGYLVTPDSTPDANDHVPEIADKAPGFEINILYNRKNKPGNGVGLFTKMIFGEDNPYELIPVIDYRFEDECIFYKRYRGSNDLFRIEQAHVFDVVYPISVKEKIKVLDDGTLAFSTYDGESITTTLEALRSQVEQKQLKTHHYLLGTDKYGRDILSRLIIGVRVSLSVGIVAVVISMFIGIIFGAVAGYFRGWVDDVFMWFINTVWSIPTLLLVFSITLAIGTSFWQIYVAVGLTMWVEVARIIRGQIISVREQQFVEAAQSLGFNHTRIIALHVLPNVLGPLFVVAAANFASAILIEAGLSFLGIGVQPPMPSWGGMLSENYGYIISGKPFLAIVPGVAIMLMVLAFNLVGNGLRDALDVRTSLQQN